MDGHGYGWMDGMDGTGWMDRETERVRGWRMDGWRMDGGRRERDERGGADERGDGWDGD